MNSPSALTCAAFFFAACLSTSQAVQIATPAQADLQVSEDLGVDGASNSAAINVNALYDTVGLKNQIVALRFDLTGKNRLQSTKAWLKLTNSKQNTTNQPLFFYGVTQGAKGYNETTSTPGDFTDNDWPENTTTFSTTPGLRFDANSVTRGVDETLTTYLGGVNVDNGNRDEGAELILSTPELQDFLTNHPDDVVTILVTSSLDGTSQKRFATKEATHLDSGTGVGNVWQPGDPEVAAGTYAPQMVLEQPGTTVKTSADAQVNEVNQVGTPAVPVYDTGSGASTSINVRSNIAAAAERNFVMAMRFDLTNVTPGQITAADLRLVCHRDTTNYQRLRFYGVNEGAKSRTTAIGPDGPYTDNDWPENTTVFSTMPGLEYDGLNTALGSGVILDRVTDLGTTYLSGGNRTSSKGSQLVFNTEKLKEFLNNHPDRIVTILLITDLASSNGDKRFASKEATGLDADPAGTVPVGTYAPSLNLKIDTFAITNITLGSGTSQVTLTWESQPGQVFNIKHSQNLIDGFPGVSATGIAADAGATTTHSFANPEPAAAKLFFRVERP